MAGHESLIYTFKRIVGGSPCTIIGRLRSSKNGVKLRAQGQLSLCEGCEETTRRSCTNLRVSGSPEGSLFPVPLMGEGVLVTAEIGVRPPPGTPCQQSQRF